MKSLTSKLTELLAFDENAMLDEYNSRGVDDNAWSELAGFAEGTRWQHARLKPLFECLAELAQQASDYMETGSQGAADCLDEALQKLTALVEKEGK